MSLEDLVVPNTVFISGVTTMGPEILAMAPEIKLQEEIKVEITMKCLPMKANCGDSLTVTIGDYFAICLILLVPPFEDTYDDREKLVSLGLLFNKRFNALPYLTILEGIGEMCNEKGMLTLPKLKKIIPNLYELFKNTDRKSFNINDEGIKLTFSLDKEKLVWKEGLPNMKPGTYFESILSLDQLMEREKTAFFLDKFILKLIANKGPIDIEEIVKNTITLESVLGSKIEFSVISEICEKYVKKGLIKKLDV